MGETTANQPRAGMLSGLTVIEFAGKGPGPFCGMLLADLGADVILVERDQATDEPGLGDQSIINRGKRSIALDLKSASGMAAALALIGRADGLIEGFRPGVMERLGLGPDICLARNPRLVYGRMTGWGQTGPLAQRAGHDLNYIAISGALWYAGLPGETPITPATLAGDVGGGALYLAVGLLAGMLNAHRTGQGTVVDAAITDGSAHMMNLLLSLRQTGQLSMRRGQSIVDGPHWARSYGCSDGRWIAVECLEPKFYRLLLEGLGCANDPALQAQFDPVLWPGQTEYLAGIFSRRTRDHWAEAFAASDACVSPILDPVEAALHPHNVARGVYGGGDHALQAAPAPRFAGSQPWSPPAAPRRGEHTALILKQLAADSRHVLDA